MCVCSSQSPLLVSEAKHTEHTAPNQQYHPNTQNYQIQFLVSGLLIHLAANLVEDGEGKCIPVDGIQCLLFWHMGWLYIHSIRFNPFIITHTGFIESQRSTRSAWLYPARLGVYFHGRKVSFSIHPPSRLQMFIYISASRRDKLSTLCPNIELCGSKR